MSDLHQRRYAHTDEDQIIKALRHLDNDEAVSAVAIVSTGLSSLLSLSHPQADICPAPYRATQPVILQPAAETYSVSGM